MYSSRVRTTAADASTSGVSVWMRVSVRGSLCPEVGLCLETGSPYPLPLGGQTLLKTLPSLAVGKYEQNVRVMPNKKFFAF